eukprot:Skav209459  [mRNA]  locus=scaffold4097:52124:57081:- [translate_table: standard]
MKPFQPSSSPGLNTWTDYQPLNVGSHILQTEAEIEWFADQAFHGFTRWKGARHKEFWTPGPIWGGVLIVSALFLNGVAPYVIRCYQLQHQVAKEEATAAAAASHSSDNAPSVKTELNRICWFVVGRSVG